MRAVPVHPAPSCARFARTIRHPSHPEHDLSLRFTPAGDCGYSWSFRCDPCAFDLHSPCAALPAAAVAPAHRHGHRLTLTYEDPMGSFDFCAVCRKGYSTARWFYTCRECGVGGHVGCVMPDMPLRDEYAALDKKQVAVANAATWPLGAVPESQQLEELLHEQGIQFARMELVPAGFCRCSPRLAKIDMLAVSLYPIQAGK